MLMEDYSFRWDSGSTSTDAVDGGSLPNQEGNLP
jgi:hypothetical protein